MRLHTANQIEGSTPQSGSSLPHRMIMRCNNKKLNMTPPKSGGMIMRCNNKKLKMTPPNTGGWTWEGGGLRRWDEMPGHILELIFNRLPFGDLCKPNTFVRVCRSWFLAALDVVFPSVAILDLRAMSTLLDTEQRRMYLVYLKLVLDTRRPISKWTMFYHPPRTYFSPEIITYIAKRTPCLQHLILPKLGITPYKSYVNEIRYWRKLVVLHTEHNKWKNFFWLARCCKNLRSLSISGCFDVKQASNIIQTLFPQLEYLSLQWSIFTIEAASLLISEVGRGNNNRGIETLDLQHCAFFEKEMRKENLVMQHTVEVNIHEKAAAAVKNYLYCEGMKLCPKCRSKGSYIRCFSHIMRGE